jgi:predicted nucleic acid-binding protein
MTGLSFADTRVAVYALDVDASKRVKALAVMQADPIISTQVVNEFLNVLRVKRQMERADAHKLTRALMRGCDVVPVTQETIDSALQIGERYQVNHWDALIVASALLAGCDTLYSKDMQDGQAFDGRLTVKNPFAGP